MQIPLLFSAYDYLEDFQVWVDGQKVDILPLPEDFKQRTQSFSQAFQFDSTYNTEVVYIFWGEEDSNAYKINDLHFLK